MNKFNYLPENTSKKQKYLKKHKVSNKKKPKLAVGKKTRLRNFMQNFKDLNMIKNKFKSSESLLNDLFAKILFFNHAYHVQFIHFYENLPLRVFKSEKFGWV